MAVRPGLDIFERDHKNHLSWNFRTRQLPDTAANDVAMVARPEGVARQQVQRLRHDFPRAAFVTSAVSNGSAKGAFLGRARPPFSQSADAHTMRHLSQVDWTIGAKGPN